MLICALDLLPIYGRLLYAIPQKCHSRVRWFTLSLHLLRLLHIKFKPICLFTVFDISSNYGRYNHVAGRQKHIGYYQLSVRLKHAEILNKVQCRALLVSPFSSQLKASMSHLQSHSISVHLILQIVPIALPSRTKLVLILLVASPLQ